LWQLDITLDEYVFFVNGLVSNGFHKSVDDEIMIDNHFLLLTKTGEGHATDFACFIYLIAMFIEMINSHMQIEQIRIEARAKYSSSSYLMSSLIILPAVDFHLDI